MSLKASIAGWLRPLFPRSGWVSRTLWQRRLDEVADAVANRTFDEIEGILRRLERELPLFGSDPGTRVGRLTRLGELYQDLAGSFEDAERLYREALALAESEALNYGTVALPMNDLGLLLTNQRRYREAEPVVEQLTSLTRDHFGDDHPEFASCLENLAAIYRQTGRTTKASEIRANAVRIRKTEEARAWSNH